MALCYATGSDWDADWTPSVPVDNDSAFIPETLASSITSGMDQGDIDLDLLYTHQGFLRDVGASGAPLLIAADLIDLRSPGGFYFACDANSAAQKTDEIRIAAAHRDAIIEIDSNAADAGDIDAIIALRGNILLKGNIQFGASCVLQVGYVETRLADVRLKIATGADTLPTLDQRGGKIISDGAITAAAVHAGELTQDTAAITTLEIYGGGKVIYNHSAATTVKVYEGGILDLMQTSEQKAITTLWRYPGSVVHMDDSLHTVTTTYDLRNTR
jgi:hypothetical protein